MCQGLETLPTNDSVPDLRRTNAARHDLFPKVVHDGLLRGLGMPSFDHPSDDEVNAIQAYVVNQAWKNYDEQERNKHEGKPS